MADLFAKVQSGAVVPKARSTTQMMLSYYARHPGLAVLTGAAGVGTIGGAAAVAMDIGERGQEARQEAAQRQRQPEPERPEFAWDWNTQSRKREFVVTLQSALNDLGYGIGTVDGSMYRKDGKPTRTQKAVDHILWTMDPTHVAGTPMTEDQWKQIEAMALQARRKRA